ncbi:MAG TPA: undecaprenyl-diphosphate phosphatase [Syntrophales bacterium]|jgi:undecaprenyl-diphosphatase|nr:undecaprenyl-diphosphate phosphatase [Syntrophales bacterium]HON23033.1 undecaprenyl-diphosphate phosphatase [Syntrophales bacterium]HOU78167.1 undecaprenyl-diphosphate phosphatase [Syntrophales bacterium]HPC33066.1 undecaprenyl-diphosphate phosphatase [Syntrophales bacterium]HQG34503.1 undecaprenyl-diphosphate phosphatase [Syntrophales bacterium]
MDLLTAAVLGVVEGVSEFLPISSTGHLILASHLLGLEHTDFLKSFEIAIQVGAIASVVFLYWRDLLVDLQTVKKVIVAFIPTGIMGLTLYKLIKHFLLGSAHVVLWSLLIGGILLIAFELWHREREDAVSAVGDISLRQALIIGCFQSLAMVPGVSRSAATIVGGLLLGLQRKVIVEFSFLLAVPTMMAATAYDLLKSGTRFSPDQFQFLGVGFITSFVVALLSIKFLLRYIQTHTFIAFGVYRIALVVFWFFVLGG